MKRFWILDFRFWIDAPPLQKKTGQKFFDSAYFAQGGSRRV